MDFQHSGYGKFPSQGKGNQETHRVTGVNGKQKERTTTRLTMSRIAELAGCSQSTVSRALAGRPEVAAATRERVCRIADEQGFEPDPAMQALIAYRHQKARLDTSWDVLAAVSVYPTLKQWRKIVLNDSYWTGIEKAAQRMGFKLDYFPLDRFDMEHSCARTLTILTNRGIRGLLLLPMLYSEKRLSLPFCYDPFAVVTIGNSVPDPRIHRIGIDYFAQTRKVCEILKKRGYRRIGFSQKTALNIRQNNTALGGFLASTIDLPESDRIPPLMARQVKPDMLIDWYWQWRPEVIVASHGFYCDYLVSAGIAVPAQCGFVQYNKSSPNSITGVQAPTELIGQQAIYQLRNCLHDCRFGPQEQPAQVYLTGTFVEGDTLRPS